jgi:D-amino peptidase
VRAFISADIEGIWGVASRKQTTGEGPEYARGRELMTREVNLACAALFENGVTAVLVNDAHGNMDNLLIEELHPRVQLISGSPKPLSMMQGIEGGHDMALFIGYHSRAGSSRSAFDHTYHGGLIAGVALNGRPVGEVGLNAYVAGYYSVPVVFVSGDKTLTQQAVEELGEIATLAVKDSITRTSAHHISFEELQQGYRQKIGEAVRQPVPPLRVEGPLILEVEFFTSLGPSQAARIPTVSQTGPKTVEIRSRDYLDLYYTFSALLDAAGP